MLTNNALISVSLEDFVNLSEYRKMNCVICSIKEGTRGVTNVGAHHGSCLKRQTSGEERLKRGGTRKLTPGKLNILNFRWQ